MIRYADDGLILCRDEQQAREARRKLRKELAQRGLRLNLNKTRVVDARQKGGFDFLGYHFERGRNGLAKAVKRSCGSESAH